MGKMNSKIFLSDSCGYNNASLIFVWKSLTVKKVRNAFCVGIPFWVEFNDFLAFLIAFHGTLFRFGWWFIKKGEKWVVIENFTSKSLLKVCSENFLSFVPLRLVQENFSQIISAADVEQCLLFGAICLTSLMKLCWCMLNLDCSFIKPPSINWSVQKLSIKIFRVDSIFNNFLPSCLLKTAIH